MSTSPVSQLQAGQARLAAGVNAVATLVDQIGYTDLACAMARLEESVAAAKERLTAAHARMQALASSLLDSLAGLALGIEESLEQLPAPAAMPAEDEVITLPLPQTAAPKAASPGPEPVEVVTVAANSPVQPAVKPAELAEALGTSEPAVQILAETEVLPLPESGGKKPRRRGR